jgi:hypothetical protein
MEYITLYPHVKYTLGTRGALLFDYVTDKIIRLPISQSEILSHIDRSITELYQIYNSNDVLGFINFIEEIDIGIISHAKYPKTYNYSYRPHTIDICEIEIDKLNVDKFKIFFNKILNHGCTTFVFLFDSLRSFYSSLSMLEQIPLSINVKFYRPLSPNDLEALPSLIHINNIYFVHVVNSAPKDESDFSNKIIWKTSSKKISPYLEVYNQSLYGHPYFLGRIYINPKGLYSNGYRNKDFLGDLNLESISCAIENLISKGNWLTKRQNIIQCRKCEFRDICLDDSQLINVDEELFSLKEKCDYEP